MALQERLDAVFGGLSAVGPPGAQQQAWRPTATQVFRSGAPLRDGDSSDEEYAEKQRREAVPGLAQALVEEDVPDAEGFRPSTAFCRQLDAEEEYNDVDEVAMGAVARHAGADPLPPRDTQVPDDNPYERRARREAGAGEPHAGMEVEGEAAAEHTHAEAEMAAAGPGPTGGPAAPPAGRSSLGASDSAPTEKRRVRFDEPEPPEGAPAPRRLGALPPGAGGQRRRSHVPDHAKRPGSWTCYTLDEPLLVGGGVGQLADGQSNRVEWQPADAEAEAEPERWQGPPGTVPFVSRQQRAGQAGRAPPVAGGAASSAPPASQQPAAAICVGHEEAEGAEPGADAEMADAAGQDAAARPKRHYRTRRPAPAAEAEAD